MRQLALALSTVGALAGCNGSTPADPSDAPTFHADIRPIVDANCVSCHNPEGIGPIDLRTGDDATASPSWAAAAAAAVAAGRMPPWLPADDCHPIDGSRGLTDDDRAAFAAWAAADFPVGDASAYQARTPAADPMEARRSAFGEPDLVLRGAEAYRPSLAQPDDYRCIPLEVDVDRDTFVQGLEIAPDKPAIVHHMILYMYYPQQTDEIAEMDARDAAEDGVGFTCFENPPADTVLAWAPGQRAEFLPDDMARYVPRGARMFMQIHYNTLGKDGADVPADQTGVRVWLRDDRPENILATLPFANQNIFLPAGDPEINERATMAARSFFGPFNGDLPVVGAMAHMHQLGSAFKLEYQSNGRGRKDCMLDIPAWDFGWQQSYFFPEDEPFSVADTDVFHMLCRYDNSAENQIVVNGERLPTRDVTWGENTTDEMCLAYLLAKIPTDLWVD